MKRPARPKRVTARERLIACVPSNWLDPLLTGPKRVLGAGPPYVGADIERLLNAIRARMTSQQETA